ncbi:MAG TPA: Na+/H+ antiporter NhaA [Chryseosolibacter sp.]|nr:Na+/H+ antiporter NhaA [Chryseosolibacter sp.]
MRLTKLFKEFFRSQKAGGIVLILCTVFSLIVTNSPLQTFYLSIWNFELGHHTITHWINDGLMAIFFLMIGLELEREVYIGELSNVKNSLLPILAALGGMVVPATIHMAFNYGTPYQAGAGIPMATDIAFALGVLSLLGNRVPVALKVFLTALAVIDDVGAILVIAFVYTGSLDWMNLSFAAGIFVFLLVLNRLKVMNLVPYLIGGVVMWYFMLNSGIHATITGVLLAFAIPFGDGSEKTISWKLQHTLHRPVQFLILPVFALANTALILHGNWYEMLLLTNSIGIAAGLIIGKPLGIISFSYLSIVTKISSIPAGMNFKQMLGAGFLGGIGFTMSIFITLLAFSDESSVEQSKISIMLSSLIAGLIGFVILKLVLRKKHNRTLEEI